MNQSHCTATLVTHSHAIGERSLAVFGNGALNCAANAAVFFASKVDQTLPITADGFNYQD